MTISMQRNAQFVRSVSGLGDTRNTASAPSVWEPGQSRSSTGVRTLEISKTASPKVRATIPAGGTRKGGVRRTSRRVQEQRSSLLVGAICGPVLVLGALIFGESDDAAGYPPVNMGSATHQVSTVDFDVTAAK